MPDNQHSFIIPDDQKIPDLVSSIRENFSLRQQPETVYHRTLYDTFDWRLYKSGTALEVHDDGRSRRIYWREEKDGPFKIQLALRNVPQLAADLPDSEFRRQLQSVISVRELLPQIKLRIKRQPYVVLDNSEKIVVRLYADTCWYSPSKLRADRVLSKRLTIKAVKGYAADYQRVEAFLKTLPTPLQTAQDNLMKLALITTGVSPEEYSTRLNLRLDPEIKGEQAFKEILLRLLEIMQQNTAGCVRGRDTEFMHDYRVAIRKIRVALKQFNQLYPQAVSKEYKNFFSHLGELTTPVRDLDLLLQLLENDLQGLDEFEQQQLQPLREYLLQTRAAAQKKLVEVLKSSSYREKIKGWRDFLLQPETVQADTGKQATAAYKLADEFLWDTNKQTLQEAKAITGSSDAVKLHELRKTFKKLRYLTEFFGSLYPAVKLRALLQSLIDVQDHLGAYNDRYIQTGLVKAFIEHSANEQAIKASEHLINILEQQQLDAGLKFKESYTAYASSDGQKIFKEMFIEYNGRKIKP